jgi:hypothetical protein
MSPASSKPIKRRSQWYRWTMRLLVASVTLVMVVIVVTEIVLSSNIPKRIVIAQVQRTLGLRVTADSVSTGWFGHTTLRNVTVSLPLASRAFLEMPEMRVTHQFLPILVATQSLTVKAISLDQPKIYVTQDRDGRWNLQDVAEILLRLGANPQPGSNPTNTPLALPTIKLTQGEIDVIDKNGRTAAITPINVMGEPSNALVWQYDASCESADGPNFTATGRVAPSDSFSHELDFSASRLSSLASLWVSNFDPSASIKGHWRGSKAGDGVSGRLQLQSAQYGTVRAEQGDIAISTSADSLTARPGRLIVQTGQADYSSLAINGGSISVDPIGAKAAGVEISALNGRLVADGAYTFADESGNLHAEWKSLAPGAALTSSGALDASLRTTWPDQKAIKAELYTTGTASRFTYAIHALLDGAGKSWDNAAWTLAAPTLQCNGKQSLTLDHLTAHLTSSPGQIALADVTLPGSTPLLGSGAFHFDKQHPSLAGGDWWLYLQGQNWAIPNADGAAIGFGVNAWGNSTEIRLQQLYGVVGRIFAGVQGYYRYAQPKPVDLNLSVCELPSIAGTSANLIRGNVRGEAQLSGTIKPLNLDASGQFHGDNVVINDQPPQQFALKFTAGVRDQLVRLQTEELKLLGGEWSLQGRIPARDPAHGDAPDLTLVVHDLPLANLGQLFHQPDVAGTAGGSIELDIDAPSADHLSGQGHFDAKDVSASQFRADSVATDVSIGNGVVAISPISLSKGNGRVRATISAQLRHPTLLNASLDATEWPVQIGSATARVAAHCEKLSIDAVKQTAVGEIRFDTTADLHDRPLLKADGKIGVDGRVLSARGLRASILGGDASGWATVDIDNPLASRGSLRWDELNLSELASYDSVYQNATGFLTGRADMAPTTDPRALAPLLLDVATVGQSSKFRSVQFSHVHLPIFLDRDRAVLAGGTADVAGGTIGLFARASIHDANTLSSQFEARLTNLDLEQLLHAADKTEADKLKSYPGELDGVISIVGDPRNRMALFGSASLAVHDSDLANFGPFAVLYDTMHLGGTIGKKVGVGTIDARYDNDNLIISSLRYFNRGIDAYGLARISELSQYPQCPISGELVGTYQPLKNINLPFFADADKIFSVLQSNLTSIVIGGTISQPSYLPESAAVIGTAMRTFLLGDVPQPK